MQQSYSTAVVPPVERQTYWHNVVGSNYFPLSLDFQRKTGFIGKLTAWEFGTLSLTHLESEALCYRRERKHLSTLDEGMLLITIPDYHEVSFTQRGRPVLCPPGGFILERSDEPYEFSYAKTNSLWVIKMQDKDLRQRIGSPDRYCALALEVNSGSGALFAGFVRLLAQNLAKVTEQERLLLSRQLLDLLALVLEANNKTLPLSTETAVQAAHLQRCQHFIRTNLKDSSLSPQKIAVFCGISTRYLHALFNVTGRTVSQWIRDQRLQSCHDSLSSTAPPNSIAQIAYEWGFSDQAHFCRIFKAHFGCSPSQYRSQFRQISRQPE